MANKPFYVNGYNIGAYATDKTHENSISKIYNLIKDIDFSTPEAIDKHITTKVGKTPITGSMIIESSKKYGTDPKMIYAMMLQDSTLGTKGKGAKTYNPGNVGNDDTGKMRNYRNWNSGVMAVSEWLAKNKQGQTKDNLAYTKPLSPGKDYDSIPAGLASKMSDTTSNVAMLPSLSKKTSNKESGGISDWLKSLFGSEATVTKDGVVEPEVVTNDHKAVLASLFHKVGGYDASNLSTNSPNTDKVAATIKT